MTTSSQRVAISKQKVETKRTVIGLRSTLNSKQW